MNATKPKLMLGSQLLYPSEYIAAEDLQGRDVTVTIEKVERKELTMQGGKKETRVVISFAGKKKRFVCNKTNGTTIFELTGLSDASKWVGKKVTLYPTTTKCGRDTVTCIRIRGAKPQDRYQRQPEPEREFDEPSFADDDAPPVEAPDFSDAPAAPAEANPDAYMEPLLSFHDKYPNTTEAQAREAIERWYRPKTKAKTPPKFYDIPADVLPQVEAAIRDGSITPQEQ